MPVRARSYDCEGVASLTDLPRLLLGFVRGQRRSNAPQTTNDGLSDTKARDEPFRERRRSEQRSHVTRGVSPSMSDRSITLTRRRVLGGVVTVGGASAAAGAGSMAFFTDTEESTGNSIKAGTLDLKLGGEDRTVTFLDATDIRPGDDETATLALENHGSLDGELEIELATIRSVDRNGGSPGDLEEDLEVQAMAGSEEVIARQTVSSLNEGPLSHPTIPVSGDGGSVTFSLSWWLPASTSNQARGDSVGLDFTFRIVQGGGGA